jgi:hypothetical protein
MKICRVLWKTPEEEWGTSLLFPAVGAEWKLQGRKSSGFKILAPSLN